MLQEPQLRQQGECTWPGDDGPQALTTLHQGPPPQLALGATQTSPTSWSSPDSPGEGPQSHESNFWPLDFLCNKNDIGMLQAARVLIPGLVLGA